MDAIYLIKRHEGFRARAYRDTRGHLTIGYGTNIETVELTEHSAGQLLADELAMICRHLSHLNGWKDLNEARRAVLLDMAYNLGVHGLLGFHDTLDYIEVGDYGKAADAMLDSDWAREVGTRAQDDATIMRTGEFD